jgi:hypothetical protein
MRRRVEGWEKVGWMERARTAIPQDEEEVVVVVGGGCASVVSLPLRVREQCDERRAEQSRKGSCRRGRGGEH